MATESNLNERTAAPAIENEIPAYRAISPGAVVALVLGVLSVLSFASWYFLPFAVAAVLLGVLADRKIRRFADVLTGRGLAQAGMTLGLVFGLTAVTVTTVQGFLRVAQARRFALTYEKVLKSRDLETAVWYQQNSDVRSSYTPAELLKESTKVGPGQGAFEERIGQTRDLMNALAEPGAEVHFLRVENHGEQELTQYAGVVYEVHTPNAKDPAQRDRRALAVIKGAKNSKGRFDWWVSEFLFPYKDKSFTAPTPEKKAGDDGHGH